VRYEARAPLRIDFAGGWTDVPLYAEREGGAVLNAAITHYVRGYVSKPTAGGLLGHLRGERSYLSYGADLPAGAGLGVSAAETVTWVTLVKTTVANDADRREIAELACDISRRMGILGGKQDEYAAALGGIGYYTFGHSVGIERLDLGAAPTERFLDRLVLAHSGVKRVSSAIHETVWARYRAGDRDVAAALSRLTTIAGEMRQALSAADLDSVAELMNENWLNQVRLSPAVTSPDLDAFIGHGMRHGAIAAKVCGAGGGGCVLFMTRAGETGRLRAALGRRVRVIDFSIDTYGVYLNKD